MSKGFNFGTCTRIIQIGDIVEVANEYGKEGRSRVSEVMYTDDTSGISIVPTFTTV